MRRILAMLAGLLIGAAFLAGTGAPVYADVYYANCDAVRAAGKAPLHRWSPGYRDALNRDGDDWACDDSSHPIPSVTPPSPTPSKTTSKSASPTKTVATATPSGSAQTLPLTGSGPSGLIITASVGLALLGAGVAAVLYARRKRERFVA